MLNLHNIMPIKRKFDLEDETTRAFLAWNHLHGHRVRIRRTSTGIETIQLHHNGRDWWDPSRWFTVDDWTIRHSHMAEPYRIETWAPQFRPEFLEFLQSTSVR